MLSVEAGTDHTYRLPLRNSGGTLAADQNSIKYSVRDGNGVSVLAEQSLTHAAGMIEAPVALSSSINTINPGGLFRVLYLRVRWDSNSKPYSLTVPYRVSPFLPITTTAADIRAVFGLTEDDLEDEELDLPGSYFELVAEKGTTFTDALVAEGYTQIAANKALLYKEALRLIPGFRLRVIASNQDGALRVDRLKTIDFEAIERAAKAGLDACLASLVTTSVILPTLIRLSSPTDAITGA